jgi:hypothetical protein
MNSIQKVEEGSMVIILVRFTASSNIPRNKPGLWSNWVVVFVDTPAMIDWVTSKIKSILANWKPAGHSLKRHVDHLEICPLQSAADLGSNTRPVNLVR